MDYDGHIALTDFGLSKESIFKEEDRTYSFCGTGIFNTSGKLLEQLKYLIYGLECDYLRTQLFIKI